MFESLLLLGKRKLYIGLSKFFDNKGIVRKGKAIGNFDKPCLQLVSQFLLVNHPKKYKGRNSQNIALFFTLLH
jgi:hypothetical protein